MGNKHMNRNWEQIHSLLICKQSFLELGRSENNLAHRVYDKGIKNTSAL